MKIRVILIMLFFAIIGCVSIQGSKSQASTKDLIAAILDFESKVELMDSLYRQGSEFPDLGLDVDIVLLSYEGMKLLPEGEFVIDTLDRKILLLDNNLIKKYLDKRYLNWSRYRYTGYPEWYIDYEIFLSTYYIVPRTLEKYTIDQGYHYQLSEEEYLVWRKNYANKIINVLPMN